MAQPRRDSPTRYVMLMASLPYMGDPFAHTRTPLSRPTLERRLGLLDPADEALLREIERLVQWEAIGASTDDAEIIRRLNRTIADLTDAHLPDLSGAVRARLELRSLVAALRYRHLGRPPPAPNVAPWRASDFAKRIAANWELPDFGLGTRHRWLLEAEAALKDDDPLGLQRLLLGEAWRDLAKRAERHAFDFTAVALYVLRWDIFDRWTRLNADEAAERFDGLVINALAPFEAAFTARGIHG